MSGGQDKADKLKTHHIDVALGKRLRDIRDAMAMTREQVARDLDVSASRIQDYEAGRRISASRLWQFCARYGVEVDTLFAGLPHHVGGNALELAEEADKFAHIVPDDVHAISAAAADLNPVERRLALAALRGMGSRRFKSP